MLSHSTVLPTPVPWPAKKLKNALKMFEFGFTVVWPKKRVIFGSVTPFTVKTFAALTRGSGCRRGNSVEEPTKVSIESTLYGLQDENCGTDHQRSSALKLHGCVSAALNQMIGDGRVSPQFT